MSTENEPVSGEMAFHTARGDYEVYQIQKHKNIPNTEWPNFHHLTPIEQAYWVAKAFSKPSPKTGLLAADLLSPELIEVGRLAVEDSLLDYRDSRISQPFRSNGLVIRESDGTPSDLVRFGPETALSIGISAMIEKAKGGA